MEYADGGSLQNYLKNNFNKLTWEDKYRLAYQLACAVMCLHDQGIVHQDLVSKVTSFIELFNFNNFNNVSLILNNSIPAIS